MKKGIFLTCLVCIFSQLSFFSVSFADIPAGNPDQFKLLQDQISELKQLMLNQQQTISEQGKALEDLRLKVEPGPSPVYIPTPGGEKTLPSWIEGMKMGGDFKLRYEGINKAGQATRDRNRFRFRLRYGLEKKLNDDFTVGFRLATGSTTDPTSTNQTFTGDFTSKNIFIDRAYVKYQANFLKEQFSHLKFAELGGGKVANPYLETSGVMFWDSDVTPEGIYESFETEFFEGKFRPFAILGQFVLNENAAATDAEMFAYQGGYRLELGANPERPVTWTSALAYYDLSDFTNSSNFTANGASLAFGNTTLGSTDLAARDFNVLNVYQDLKFKVGSLPVKLFGEYDHNLNEQAFDPNDRNQAYQFGLGLGEAKLKGDWQTAWYYAYIEPNSVAGAISDSDFGDGHANQMGNNLEANYMLTDFLKLRFKASFTNNVMGVDEETRRFQADLDWKF